LAWSVANAVPAGFDGASEGVGDGCLSHCDQEDCDAASERSHLIARRRVMALYSSMASFGSRPAIEEIWGGPDTYPSAASDSLFAK